MAVPTIYSVVQNLGRLLVEESNLLEGVRDEVEWLESELRRIQCFLQDADSKRRRGDDRVKNWIREVRDVAFRAEDTIDIYLFKIESRQRQRGSMGSVRRYAFFLDELIARHRVHTEIKWIRNKMHDISESRITYGISNIGENGGEGFSSVDQSLEARRRLSPYLYDDTIVVGLKKDMNLVLNQLLDAGNGRRCVISIVGMGGLGKTTLAKMIYNHCRVEGYFDACAWVTVSQEYSVRDLLTVIIMKVDVGVRKAELEALGDEELKERLHGSLRRKMFLIVMDDVWRTHVWIQLKAVFPDTNNGSRVLFTTRFREVAQSADPVIPPYELPFLNDEESWELFLTQAFPSDHLGARRSCPEELEGIGRQLVKRCGGLPLALLVLGGFMSRRDPNPIVWQEVAESMDWESTQDGQICFKILALSYSDLPHHHLKSCFLYIGAFPEDSVIYTSKLIKLWIAEGFVPERVRQSKEETARDYLDELVQRFMIQVVKRRNYDNRIRSIQIHDVLRDFCISEAREDGFLNVHSGNHENNSAYNSYARRLALHYDFSCKDFSRLKLRTLLVFKSSMAGDVILRGLKFLRVLDLEGAGGLMSLPGEIKGMIHLRYLSLRGCTSIRNLPSSIREIRTLQTLDVRRTSIQSLPVDLGKIQTLKVIYKDWNCALPKTTFNLRSLQTLKDVDAEGGWFRKGLSKLTSLRELGISGLRSSQHGELCDSLQKLTHLVSLKLQNGESVPMGIIKAFSTNRYIQKLTLYGMLSGMQQELPAPHEFPQNLSKLRLSNSMLKKDPMPVLANLRFLTVLYLSHNAYAGNEMACPAGGFPRLRFLALSKLEVLACWSVEVAAFPRLTVLYISLCKKLRMLPEGLRQATSLRELTLTGMSQEFNDRVQEQGADWHKIRHVRSISIHT